MGAVLRRLLDIPAPERTGPPKRPDPPATNDGPGLAHQHRMRSANSRCSRSPPKDSIRCGWTAGASIVQKHLGLREHRPINMGSLSWRAVFPLAASLCIIGFEDEMTWSRPGVW